MPIMIMRALSTVIVSPLCREHLKVRLKHPAHALWLTRLHVTYRVYKAVRTFERPDLDGT